jgi:peptide/nickel transport system permease protein
MSRYVLRRALAAVPLLLVVTFVSFVLMQLAPGGPLGGDDPHRRDADVQRLEHAMGWDRPWYEQYPRWLGALLHGDLGTSLVTAEPVSTMIAARVPATLELMGTSLLLSLVVGVGVGMLAALRRGTWVDHLFTVCSAVGLAVPVFWLGVLSIVFFAAHLGWLPAGGRNTVGTPYSLVDHLRHLVLPVLVLAVVQTPAWVRHLRASMLDVLGEDWLRAARARGLSERRVLLRHALRPALVPVVTLLGLQAPALFTGAAITEAVFAWPGIGRLFYEGTQRFDYPRLMGILVISSALVIVCNVAADVLAAKLDPRLATRERS